jgi:hypothetical protein
VLNCGFAQRGEAISCTPGATAKVRCTGGAQDHPANVRLCEGSSVFGLMPCLHNEALAKGAQVGEAQELTFTCPDSRDIQETGGIVGLFVGPMVPGDDTTDVTCALVEE